MERYNLFRPADLTVEQQLNLPDLYTPAAENIEIWDETVKRGIFDETFEYPNPINGQPWSEYYKQIYPTRIKTLASFTYAKNIYEVIKNHQVSLITMGTGAGKTVMLPKLMFHYYGYQKKIAVTIPRRGITESAAVDGATLLDIPLGAEVGYRHGSEKDKATDQTRLLYTTDGTIKTKLTSNDPELNEFQCVIIDEAHERNVNIDILFSLLVSVCQARPDFKLIIMSATIDPSVFINFFEKNKLTIKHYHVAGEVKYKIDKIFLDRDIKKKEYPMYAAAYLEQILKNTNEGDIMLFFPTLTKVMAIIDELKKPENLKYFHGKPCFIAYSGSASQEEKDLVIKKDEETKVPYYKTRGYTRCVIFTTPAAESSLTTAGNIVYVIEPGYAKAVWYDPTKFADIAQEVRITKSSIIQRQGRTGRVCDGQAYMLYTKEYYDKLPEFNEPEILKNDLTNDILSIMNLPTTQNLQGTLKFLSNMITPPMVESVESGVKILYNYSMIDSKGELTDLGRTCIKLSKLGPEIARMLLASYYFGCMEDIVLLSAMMISSQGKTLNDYIKSPNETDPTKAKEAMDFYNKTMKRFVNPRGDHFTLINIAKEYLKVHPLDRMKWCRQFKFSYDLFSNSIEADIKSIRDSLQNIEFPQMFTHFPPPPKFERPPRDIIEFLTLRNKQLMDKLFGKNLPQTRFNFQYGGNEPSSRNNLDYDSDEMKGGFFTNPREFQHKPKKQKHKQHDKKNKPNQKEIKDKLLQNLEKLENNFNIHIDNNNHIEPSSRTTELDNDDNETSLGLWEVKEDIKLNKTNTTKLLQIVKNNYKKKHIQDLEIDPDLKKTLLSDKPNPKFDNTDDEDEDTDNVDLGNLKEEENMMNDEFFIQELNPEIKTKEDIINDFNKSQQLAETLENLKKIIINPVPSIKIKNKNKQTRKKLRYDKKHKNQWQHSHKRLTKKRKLGGGLERGGGEGGGEFGDGLNEEEREIINHEKEKFGKFIDQISLKTEVGILPKFRVFEDPEENILACIFYGFYMRLGVNYYQNKYLVKLSKIDADNQENSTTYDKNKKNPSLIVYQNLTINMFGPKLGIVSEITPKIINSFI